MQKTDTLYTAYVEVLKEELLPAMGCTEPIAIAYAAAAARRILNELPCEVCVTASGNIIKNVKSVFVPNTGGLRGIPAAAAAGARTHHMQKPQGHGVRIAAAFQHLPRPGPQGLHAEHGTRLVGGIGKLPDVGIHPAFRILRTCLLYTSPSPRDS